LHRFLEGQKAQTGRKPRTGHWRQSSTAQTGRSDHSDQMGRLHRFLVALMGRKDRIDHWHRIDRAHPTGSPQRTQWLLGMKG
jgi:hypothetical protein